MVTHSSTILELIRDMYQDELSSINDANFPERLLSILESESSRCERSFKVKTQGCRFPSEINLARDMKLHSEITKTIPLLKNFIESTEDKKITHPIKILIDNIKSILNQ